MRELTLPVIFEFHAAPRNLGDPVQDFALEMMLFDGRIEKDSDFETFFISAGQFPQASLQLMVRTSGDDPGNHSQHEY